MTAWRPLHYLGQVTLRSPARLAVTLVALATGLAGCEADREAELLEVTEVSPLRLEPGRLVVVEGRGFPPGREARVRLSGTASRPGAAPTEVTVEIDGRARSAERVEARFTREALAALGGRATLHGRVAVVFDAQGGGGRVIGRSDELTVDVSTASTRGLSEALSRRRRAETLVAGLGLTLTEESPQAEGLPITEVREGSVAERAGLVAGDRLVELEGVQTHELADAVPPPGRDAVTLRIGRRGEPVPFAVRVPTPTTDRGADRELVTAAQIALAWVLLTLLLVAPSAGLIDAIARRTLPGGAPRTSPRRLRAKLREAWRRHRAELGIAALALGLAGSLPGLDRAFGVELPLEWLALGALAVRVSAAWVASPRGDRGARALALGQAFGSIAIAAVAIGSIAAIAGTAQLFTVARSQGELPTDWTLLRTPIAPLALGLLVWAAVHAPPDLARGRDVAARIARGLDDVVLLALAIVATAIFLGGWSAASDDPGARLRRACVFAAFAWGGWLWMRRARRIARWTRLNTAGAALGTLALVGLVALWVGLEPDPALVEGLGQVVAGALAFAGALLVYRLASGKLRRAPHPAQPFL